MNDMTPAPISVERLCVHTADHGDDRKPYGMMMPDARGEYVRHSDYAALLHRLADAEAQLEDARWQLAYCFQQAGADTDGHFGPHLAPRALQAVTELRRDYDEACSAEHPAPFSVRHFKRKAEAAERAREETCGLLREAFDSIKHAMKLLGVDTTPEPTPESIGGRIAAFLAASGGA